MEPEGSLLCSQKPATGPTQSQANPVYPKDPYLPKVAVIIVKQKINWSWRKLVIMK